MATNYWVAEDYIKKEAEELIASYHNDIVGAKIAYLKKDTASKSEIESGRVCTAKKVSTMYKALTGEVDFIIVISSILWNELGDKEQTAALDSALTSCTAEIEDGEFILDDSGNPKFGIKSFDVIEHLDIIQRYGIEVLRDKADSIMQTINTLTLGAKKATDDNEHISEQGTGSTRKSKKASTNM